MFTIKRIDPKTVAAKANIRLDYVFAVLFAIPFFMAVPPGYITMLTVIGAIIAMVAAMVSIYMIFRLLDKKLIQGKFFTPEHIVAWIIVGIIVTSMFTLQMTHVATFYLTLVVANNIMKYVLMGYRA